MGTIFSVFPDFTENPTVAKVLKGSGERIVLASDRQQAFTELRELGDDVSALIVGVREHIDEAILQHLPNCRVVGSISVGTDHLDLAALQARNISVVTAKPGANAISVAEHTLMMILAISKQLFASHSAVLSGKDRAGLTVPSRELFGKTIGILGAGYTALALARLLKPFGVKILVWTPHPNRHPEMLEIGAAFISLPELFENCDVVSVHLPLSEQTQGLLNYERLTALKPYASIINVARLQIFAIPELVDVVAARPDLQFGIDDFELKATGVVAALGDRCIVTPHIAGVTTESQERMDADITTEVVNQLTYLVSNQIIDNSVEVVTK